jgi:hypothetical protein
MTDNNSAATTWPRRLNLGCGGMRRDDCLNVDSSSRASPDLLVTDHDYTMLPRGHFDEIFAHGLLETLPRTRLMDTLFDCADLLAEGGRLEIETADLDGFIRRFSQDGSFENIHNTTADLFGNQASPVDERRQAFTPRTLGVYLWAVGLEPGEFTSGDGCRLRVAARKYRHWRHLEEIESYAEFIQRAFVEFLDRDADDWRLGETGTAMNSRERCNEIRTLAGAPERLYKIGDGRIIPGTTGDHTTSSEG